jgi:hypothetical protein
VRAPRSARFGKRSLGIAATASVVAIALAAISLAVSSPESPQVELLERPATASTTSRVAEEAPVAAAEVAPAANETEPIAAPSSSGVVATDPVIISDLPRAELGRAGSGGSRSSDAADDSREDADEATPSSGRRRYSSARLRAQHKAAKAKAAARTGSTRIAKHNEAEPRVLPLPQPSERQLRTKAAAMGQPAREPLNLAPDPYDQNR